MLNFEQFDELEILPGIPWGIHWANIDVSVDEDGDIDGIWLNGQKARIALSPTDTCPIRKHLYGVLHAVLKKESADTLEEAGRKEKQAQRERDRDSASADRRETDTRMWAGV